MKRMAFFFASLFALNCWFLTAASWACMATATPPERLCQDAPVVVRAAAARYLKEPEEVEADGGKWVRRGRIEFKVLETLKGEHVPATLALGGFLSDSDDFNEGPVPYQGGRPGTKGGCFAEGYKQGAEFLLFLMPRGEEFIVLPAPLSAASEQLRSDDDPWLIWVRRYLKLQKEALPQGRRGGQDDGNAPGVFGWLYHR